MRLLGSDRYVGTGNYVVGVDVLAALLARVERVCS
jgi:hypothetical protein